MAVKRNQYPPSLYELGTGYEQLLPPDGVVIESEMRRYSVFCGKGLQPNERLVCCAQWEHWMDTVEANLSVGKISEMLKADGWTRRKKLWVCPECAKQGGKRRHD